MYLHWLALLPLSLAFTLLAWLLAPVLPLFASRNGWLPDWLAWFQTPDNSLDGDTGWINEHWQFRYWLPAPLCTYVGRVGWLWRNPAYGFEWEGPLCADIDRNAIVIYHGDTSIQDKPNGKEGYCFTEVVGPERTYWHLYFVKLIGTWQGQPYCLNINLGWKLKTYAEDPRRIVKQPKARYCFSPRVSGFNKEN